MGRGDSFGKQNFWMISDWSSSLNLGYQVGPMETTPKARKKGQPREMNLTAQCLICNGPAAAHQVFLGRLYIWCWFPTLCCYCGCLDPQPPPTDYGTVWYLAALWGSLLLLLPSFLPERHHQELCLCQGGRPLSGGLMSFQVHHYLHCF